MFTSHWRTAAEVEVCVVHVIEHGGVYGEFDVAAAADPEAEYFLRATFEAATEDGRFRHWKWGRLLAWWWRTRKKKGRSFRWEAQNKERRRRERGDKRGDERKEEGDIKGRTERRKDEWKRRKEGRKK
jgi:hypothetical protein